MQGGKADVIGCRFTRNEITSNGYGPGAAIGAENGSAYIYDCLFENNHSVGTSGGWITKAVMMSNCVVRCNTSGVVVFNAAAKGETPSWQYKFASDSNYSGALAPIGDIFGGVRPLEDVRVGAY